MKVHGRGLALYVQRHLLMRYERPNKRRWEKSGVPTRVGKASSHRQQVGRRYPKPHLSHDRCKI